MAATPAPPLAALLTVVVATAVGACSDGEESTATSAVSGEPAQAYCQLMQQFEDAEPNGDEGPDELEAKLDEIRPLLSRLNEVAPAEIGDETEASVAAYAELFDLVAAAEYDLGAVDGTQMGALSTEIDANGAVIQNWLDGHCGAG